MVPVGAQEDDVPDTNSGTQQVVEATPGADEQPSILADLAEALRAQGNPDPEPLGHSKEAKAEATEAKDETPVAAKAKEPEKAPAKAADGTDSDAPKAPDFSVLPDSIKPIFEQLHKDGHLPKEAAEEIRKGYLRTADYTQKRMADADERRAWQKERDEKRDMIAAVEGLLSDPKRLAAFNRALDTDTATEPEAEGILSGDAEAAKAIDQRIDRKLTAKEKEAQAVVEAEDRREESILSAVNEFYDTVKADVPEADMKKILQAEDAAWTAKGVNLRRSGNPADVVDRLSMRVEVYLAKKQASMTEAQLAKKQADAARSAKASSSPTTRAAAQPEYDLRTSEGRLRKTLADEGIEDWSQVRLGNPGFAKPV